MKNIIFNCLFIAWAIFCVVEFVYWMHTDPNQLIDDCNVPSVGCM